MSPGLRPPYSGALPPSLGEINADFIPKVANCKVCSADCRGRRKPGGPSCAGTFAPRIPFPPFALLQLRACGCGAF